jgi:hypothetical protein
VQAGEVGNPGPGADAELLSLAKDVERLSASDPTAAAAVLDELHTGLRSMLDPRSCSAAVLASIDQLDEQLDDLARRLRTGYVKAVAGLERHLRLVLPGLGIPASAPLPGSAPNR